MRIDLLQIELADQNGEKWLLAFQEARITIIREIAVAWEINVRLTEASDIPFGVCDASMVASDNAFWLVK